MWRCFKILGVEYVFSIEAVGGYFVLAASFEIDGEFRTIWTAERDVLPKNRVEARDFLRSLDWADDCKVEFDYNKAGYKNDD